MTENSIEYANPVEYCGDNNAKMREFTVRPCLNGYIVTVGCQCAVFRRGEEDLMANQIAAYVKNPKVTAERYLKESAVV